MKKHSVILAGLLVAVCFAFGLAFIHPGALAQLAAAAAAGAAFVAGTATVTYLTPIHGTTPPTAAQIRLLSSVTVTINFGDTDTSAVITHNFGLSAAEAADGYPWTPWWIVNPGTVVPLISFVNTDTNTVTVTKALATGTNCTIEVAVLRPDTNIR